MRHKHQRKWFENRVGQFVMKNGEPTLFNPPIKIESKGQAVALYLTQVKGHRYEAV